MAEKEAGGGLGSEIFIAMGVLTIIVVMIIPLPTMILDVLIAVDIAISILVIIVSMYVKEPLVFSAFPSVILLTTLFRLSLNGASTRLILLHADAGEIIRAFGDFVIGGNYAVGLVIFLIMVLVNFFVVSHGAVRIGEVHARFTLDAMPGKQMAIDADLNNGIISESEAQQRREKISKEADFFGAMDGASRFVSRDASAGLIITVINILGGFIIGVFQLNMSWEQALKTYTMLTVGDGLVAAIPALIVSTATGLIVTRAAAETNLGAQLGTQMLKNPKALMMSSVMMLVFGLIPGLPTVPFLLLASVTGFLAYQGFKNATEQVKEEEQQKVAEDLEATRTTERVESLLQVDPMELEIGYALIPLIDKAQGGDLLERVTLIRRQTALEQGIIVPPIRIRDNMQLAANSYMIHIRGANVAQGEILPDHYLAMDPGTVTEPITGIETVEPAFGLPAMWVPAIKKDAAEMAGYTVVDPSSVLATHLTEVIKTHADELLSRQDVQRLVDNIKETNKAVVDELIPNILSLGEVQKVLQNLLKEKVSIRDLASVMEALSDAGRVTKDIDLLTEYARIGLRRFLTNQYKSAEGQIMAITLDPNVEQKISQSVQQTDRGAYLALEPGIGHKLIEKISQALEKAFTITQQPVLLVPPNIRFVLQRFLAASLPNVAVLSYNEIVTGIEIKSIGMVNI